MNGINQVLNLKVSLKQIVGAKLPSGTFSKTLKFQNTKGPDVIFSKNSTTLLSVDQTCYWKVSDFYCDPFEKMFYKR